MPCCYICCMLYAYGGVVCHINKAKSVMCLCPFFVSTSFFLIFFVYMTMTCMFYRTTIDATELSTICCTFKSTECTTNESSHSSAY